MRFGELLRNTLRVFTTDDLDLAGELSLDMVAWWEDTFAGRLLWRMIHPEFPPEELRDDVPGFDLGSLCKDPWARYSLRLHDACHAALGYDTTPRGEGELAAYMLANGVVDPGYAVTVAWALRHGTPARVLVAAARRGAAEPSVVGRVL